MISNSSLFTHYYTNKILTNNLEIQWGKNNNVIVCLYLNHLFSKWTYNNKVRKGLCYENKLKPHVFKTNLPNQKIKTTIYRKGEPIPLSVN